MKNGMRQAIAGGCIAAVVAILDQSIKRLVETNLAYREMVEIIPFLAFYRTHNTGMAFSMLDDLGPVALIALAVGVAAFVIYLWSRTPPEETFARLGFALILGGAAGNLIDRINFGHVVDYILFHTPVWSFAIFNLADAAITIGAMLVVLQEVLRYRRGRTGRNSPGRDD